MHRLKPPASSRPAAGAVAALALGALLTGCATVPQAPGGAAASDQPITTGARHDPFEGLNRGLFHLGTALDNAILHPIVEGYRRIAPRPVRRAVHNFVQNLDEPVVFANDVLQVHPKAAAKTAVRFFANSTVGVGGIFDAASSAGLPHHDNGFGSTLGRYGVGPGPYIYAPLLGPTTLRDAFGEGVDFAMDPLSWTKFGGAETFGIARTGLDLLDQREQAEADLRALRATAVDPYATMRSVYLQSRQAEVQGDEAPLEPLPELPEPPPAQPEAAPADGPPASPAPSPSPPSKP